MTEKIIYVDKNGYEEIVNIDPDVLAEFIERAIDLNIDVSKHINDVLCWSLNRTTGAAKG